MAVQAEIKWRDTVVASLDRVDVGSASEFRANINNNTTQVAEAFNTVSKEYEAQVDAELAKIKAQGDTEVAEVKTEGATQVKAVETMAGSRINLSFCGNETERKAFEAGLPDANTKVYLWFDTEDATA